MNRHFGMLLQSRTLRLAIKQSVGVTGSVANKKPSTNIGEESFTAERQD